MKQVEYKMITQNKKTYLVSRHEYSTYTVYAAWEPATKSGFDFLTGHSHRTVYTGEKGVLWGDIATRVWPEQIELMTPMSPARKNAEARYTQEGEALIAILLYAGFKARPPFMVKRDTPIELKEEKTMVNARSPLTKKPDPDKEKHIAIIKKIVEVADFTRLKQLAKLNDVVIKEKDSAGLLKMRLMNAFKSILSKGGKIVET